MAKIDTARLDAQLLAAEILQRDKSWLLAHGDHGISEQQLDQLQSLLVKREKRVPIAYLLGVQEFYGRQFKVTPDTLIPRPETELIVDVLSNLHPEQDDALLDVGTGSGAIAISAKLEHPQLHVAACDISTAALTIAKQNATQLQADVAFYKSDLLSGLPEKKYRFIIANLPYVGRDWDVSPELQYEPTQALFANKDGLELIFKLLGQAPRYLQGNGYILLEADPRQHTHIIKRALNYKLRAVQAQAFVVILQLTKETLQA